MKDYISRQAAIDTVAKHFRIDNDLLEVIVYEMERLPSAQPEIIHCKECRYHGMAICRIWSRYGTINTPGYGFCFRGERRTDD